MRKIIVCIGKPIKFFEKKTEYTPTGNYDLKHLQEKIKTNKSFREQFSEKEIEEILNY